MLIEPFYERDSGTWCYLLADSGQGEAAIIDPVWHYDPVSGKADLSFTEQVLRRVEEGGFKLAWVLETHAHADHLSSAAYIRNKTGARIAIGRGIRSVQENFRRVFNISDLDCDGSQFDRLLSEGDVVRVGSLEVRVMETPGHTNDSLTYLVGDAAFIGDTLFAPAFGTARCDFPGGDAAMLFDSIARIHALPPETRLHLCHDYPPKGEAPTSMVTVAESRVLNIHANTGVAREEYVEMRRNRDATLSLPRLLYPSLQVNIRAGIEPEPENNGASYLRIPFNMDIGELLKRSDG